MLWLLNLNQCGPCLGNGGEGLWESSFDAHMPSRQFLEASGPGQTEQTILTHLPPTPPRRTETVVTKPLRSSTALANICCGLTLCQARVRCWGMEGTQCCPAGEKEQRCDGKVGPSQLTGHLWIVHPRSLTQWLRGPQTTDSFSVLASCSQFPRAGTTDGWA